MEPPLRSRIGMTPGTPVCPFVITTYPQFPKGDPSPNIRGDRFPAYFTLSPSGYVGIPINSIFTYFIW